MMGPFLRKYGVQTTFNFNLFEVDGVDMRVDAVHAAGDTVVMKDEGAEASTTNGFTDEGTGYSIVLTATEMQAARLLIHIVDLTATKVWLDVTIVIETYGNASAQHAVDLDDAVRAGLTALPNAAADAAGGLPISDAGGLDLDDIPITSEFEARTLVAADYFDPAADAVANVTLCATTTTNTDVRGTDSALLASTFSTMFNGITSLAQWLGALFGKQVANSTALTEIKATGAGSGTYDESTDSLEAIRDRGDAGWVTGAGGSVPDILTVNPLLPPSIDLADTATWRLGLMLTNAIDNLPTTAEITPGTISIDRKASGGTTWSAVVTDAACLELDGLVYFDEVFDSGTGYAAGDSIRVTFKSQKITVAANDHEITGSAGIIFYTQVGVPMRGTDDALLAASAPTNFGALGIESDGDVTKVNLCANTTLVDTATTLTNKTGFSLSATGLDLILVTSTFVAALIKGVWDRVLSAANHNIAGSSGKRVRQLEETLVAAEGSISDVGPTTADFDTDLTDVDTYWEDMVLVFTTGAANEGVGRPITAFLNANGNCTFDEAWPVTPVNGDNFLIRAGHVHPVTEIADAVLDEALAEHTTAGTLGKAVADTEADVDKVTGADGATLATAQALYAPSKAGDAMALTSAERDAVANAMLDLTDAIETGVDVRLALQVMGAALCAVSTDDGKEFYAMAPGGGSTAGTKRIDAAMTGKNRTSVLLDGS